MDTKGFRDKCVQAHIINDEFAMGGIGVGENPKRETEEVRKKKKIRQRCIKGFRPEQDGVRSVYQLRHESQS
jgi:hypothetical protein